MIEKLFPYLVYCDFCSASVHVEVARPPGYIATGVRDPRGLRRELSELGWTVTESGGRPGGWLRPPVDPVVGVRCPQCTDVVE